MKLNRLHEIKSNFIYRHKIDIYREAEEKQPDGSTRKIRVCIVNDVPCLISSKKADAPAGGDVNTISETFKLFCGPRTDIAVGDIIEAGGKKYLVGEPFEYPEHLEALITRSDLS